MLDRQVFININNQNCENQNLYHPLQPTYNIQSALMNMAQQESLSRGKSKSLTSTRSKGLTLSLRKQFILKKQTDDSTHLINPQKIDQIERNNRKKQSPLVKTSHTIHYLGKSLSKSKDDKNTRSNLYDKNVNLQYSNRTNLCHQESQSKRKFATKASKEIIQFQNTIQSQYQVKISAPTISNEFEDSKKNECNQNRIGKVAYLKNKSFLRSSKNQNLTKNNRLNKCLNKREFIRPSILKNSHKQIQIKSKRQFLQSYIQKPMINSIIVSGHIDNINQQPQSPVLRLKKRLQLNSINCIYQKQTLVSHEINDNKNQTIQVQQSIIVHRNISQNFIPITHKVNIFIEGEDYPYKLYLALQKYLKLIFTIKQLPFQHFQKFAREIRIYQQLESNRFDTNNVLQLIKFSTDSDKYLTIKQPYTETLHDYLQNLVIKKITKEDFQTVVQSILKIIQQTIVSLEQKNIYLKRQFTLNDFVFVYSNLKFQNMQMFQIKNHQNNSSLNSGKQVQLRWQSNINVSKIIKWQTLRQFQEQMLTYFNRISSGSLDF